MELLGLLVFLEPGVPPGSQERKVALVFVELVETLDYQEIMDQKAAKGQK